MTKTRVRVTSCLLWVLLSLLSFYHPSPANAETYLVTQNERDFYFTSVEQSTMTVRAFAWEHGIDAMLWVFTPDNSLVTANDDYFGLDSFVSFTMEPNVTYRVHAGVCCWDENRWYGTSYVIEPSIAPENASPQTTTTVEPSTTLVSLPTTVPTTTTSTSTTTSTTTTTTVPETTTTVPETTTFPPVRTTTTTEPVLVAVSTTTSAPEPQTTTTLSRPVTTTTSTTLPPQTTLLQTTTTSESPSTTTTTLPPVVPNMAPEQALALATSPETLQALSQDEATEVFAAVDTETLTDEQAEALIEAVQDAPEDVRAAFEDEINIFGGKFDNYVPLGSNVSVKARKVIVAASGVLFMAPTVSVSSATTSSSSSTSDSRKRR